MRNERKQSLLLHVYKKLLISMDSELSCRGRVYEFYMSSQRLGHEIYDSIIDIYGKCLERLVGIVYDFKRF